MDNSDDDEDRIPLSGSAVKVVGDVATKLERKERKTSSAPEQYLLGHVEDLEEDKRE